MNMQSFSLVILLIVSFVLQTTLAPASVVPAAITTIAMLAIVVTSLGAAYLAERQYRRTRESRGQYVFLTTFFFMIAGTYIWVANELPRINYFIRHMDSDLLFRAVAISLSVAVAEEVVFRCWLLQACTKRMPAFVAVCLSALIFQLAHATLLPTPFIMGLLLGYMAHRYHSLIAPILIHLVYDTIWNVGGMAGLIRHAGVGAAVSDENLFRTVSALGFYAFCVVALAYVIVLFMLDRRARPRATSTPTASAQHS